MEKMRNSKKASAKKSKVSVTDLGIEGNQKNSNIDVNDELSKDETATHNAASSSLEWSDYLLKTGEPIKDKKIGLLFDGIHDNLNSMSRRNPHRSSKLLPPQQNHPKNKAHIDASTGNSTIQYNGRDQENALPQHMDENGLQTHQRKSSMTTTTITKETVKNISQDSTHNHKRKRKRVSELNQTEKPDLIEPPVFTYSGEQDGSGILGDDGNLFICHICHDVGDVVCCDGCPKVYHVNCIPINCESRLSLERNDDPWYCPDCITKQTVILPNGEPGVTIDKYRRSPRLKADQNPVCTGINGNLIHRTKISPQINGNSVHHTKIYPKRAHGRPKDVKEKYDFDQTSNQSSSESDDYKDLLEQLKSTSPMPITSVKATSPFHLFLMNNRVAIERNLVKRNQEFKRAKKGMDRNLFIAKEGAKRWRRASMLEREKYIELSMQEFETKIILWKEDKVIREMMGLAVSSDSSDDIVNKDMKQGESLDNVNLTSMSLENDTQYWESRQNHLFSLSRLDTVPMKSGPFQNNVLIQLLKDQRFQTVQLMNPSRTDAGSDHDEGNACSKSHLDIQGPTSTNIGDICAGCARGWNHFCPILKAIIPAVGPRAKLQPPINSLMMTRIGAGMFMPTTNFNRHDSVEPNFLEPKSASILDHTSRRYDESISFIETVALASLDHPYSSTNINERKIFTCSSCGIISESMFGCVSCRKIKLVQVMSRNSIKTITANDHVSESDDRRNLQAKMLKNADMKTNSFHLQNVEQMAFARATLRKLWKPNVIMPDNYQNPTDMVSKPHAMLLQQQSDILSSNDIKLNPLPNDVCNVSASTATTVRASTRLKGTQNKTDGMSTQEIKPDKCQELAVEHRDEAVALQKHCLFISILGILSGLIRRDPLGLFAEPVPDSVENYRVIISEPIDFSHIRCKALEGNYNSLNLFIADVRRLCRNALTYNVPWSIYYITATELNDSIDEMQIRANKWMNAIKIAHAAQFNRRGRQSNGTGEVCKINIGNLSIILDEELVSKLRVSWPGAVEILENSEWLRSGIASDTFRTKENECALYGYIAIRRASKASEISRSVTAGPHQLYYPCIARNHVDDEELRSLVDRSLSTVIDFPVLTDISSWRENQVLRMLKFVRDRSLELLSASTSGCARCDELQSDDDGLVKKSFSNVSNKKRMAEAWEGRVDRTRMRVNGYSSHQSSSNYSSAGTIFNQDEDSNDKEKFNQLSVRGSRIHGWGLFADESLKKGEVVAEYIGEWVGNVGK